MINYKLYRYHPALLLGNRLRAALGSQAILKYLALRRILLGRHSFVSYDVFSKDLNPLSSKGDVVCPPTLWSISKRNPVQLSRKNFPLRKPPALALARPCRIPELILGLLIAIHWVGNFLDTVTMLALIPQGLPPT